MFLRTRAVAGAQITVAVFVAGQVTGEFGQCHLIDTAFELDHDIERHPVVVPPPGVELGMVGGAQVQVPVLRNQAQQVPDLFLTLVMAARIPADEAVWHFVAQPVPCAGDDADVFGLEAHLFMQFAVHGLFRGLPAINAALRKLPGVRADALAPEHLVSLVEQNDADIGPEAFSVKHNQPQIFELSGLCIAHDRLRTD